MEEYLFIGKIRQRLVTPCKFWVFKKKVLLVRWKQNSLNNVLEKETYKKMERKAIQRKHEWQFRKQKFVKQYKMTSCTTRVKAKVQ